MNIIKRLFYKIWDPHFVKLTPAEERAMLEADDGEYIQEAEFWRRVEEGDND